MRLTSDMQSPGRRLRGRWLVAATLLMTAVLGSPMSANAVTPGDCPEMSDSVVRLYSAYFGREPDAGGLQFWVDEYSSGRRSLLQISEEFSRSAEFIDTYGPLSDAEFVVLIYRNILGRAPEKAGADFWELELRFGVPRGHVMIGFSESREFVQKTATIRPLAGFGRVYPTGVIWLCGRGPARTPLEGVGPSFRFDALAINLGSDESVVTIDVVGASPTRRLFFQNVQPLSWILSWPIRDNGPVETGGGDRDLVVTARGGEVDWTLVFYPAAMALDRPGWDDIFDLPPLLR